MHLVQLEQKRMVQSLTLGSPISSVARHKDFNISEECLEAFSYVNASTKSDQDMLVAGTGSRT